MNDDPFPFLVPPETRYFWEFSRPIAIYYFSSEATRETQKVGTATSKTLKASQPLGSGEPSVFWTSDARWTRSISELASRKYAFNIA